MRSANIAALLERLSSVYGSGGWGQLAGIVLGIVVGVIAHGFARRVSRKRPGLADKLRLWPIGVIVTALALWTCQLGFRGLAMEASILRLAALLATFYSVALISLRGIGRTALGWSAVVIAGVFTGLEILHLTSSTIAALDARGILFGSVRITPWFVIRAIVVTVGLLWVTQRLGDMLEASLKGEQFLSRSGRVLLVKLSRVALLVTAVFVTLGFLGVNIATLAVLSGAVGLGLGFGLQKVISNYMSGLILLMDRSIKPGDVIEVEFSGEKIRGEVTELAGRYTAITLRTGTETLIPNEVLISNPVNNWSHTSRNVQIRIPVGVAYSADIETAISLCVEAALAAPRVLQTPKPACLILGFADSAVELNVRFWISDAERGIRNVSSGVYLEIWKRFREHGIEIPFPQRDIHIRSSFHAPTPDEGSRA